MSFLANDESSAQVYYDILEHKSLSMLKVPFYGFFLNASQTAYISLQSRTREVLFSYYKARRTQHIVGHIFRNHRDEKQSLHGS